MTEIFFAGALFGVLMGMGIMMIVFNTASEWNRKKQRQKQRRSLRRQMEEHPPLQNEYWWNDGQPPTLD